MSTNFDVVDPLPPHDRSATKKRCVGMPRFNSPAARSPEPQTLGQSACAASICTSNSSLRSSTGYSFQGPAGVRRARSEGEGPLRAVIARSVFTDLQSYRLTGRTRLGRAPVMARTAQPCPAMPLKHPQLPDTRYRLGEGSLDSHLLRALRCDLVERCREFVGRRQGALLRDRQTLLGVGGHGHR